MASLPTNPETNLITVSQLSAVKAREIEFTQMFVENINKLIEALGTSRPIEQAPNTVLKTYEAVGTLEGGEVSEGEIIPLSQYEIEERTYKEASLKKWRKATSAESILRKGYDIAVEKTTDKMLLQVQKEMKADFFDFLKRGTGRASGTTLQEGMAKAWGQLQVFFEDYDGVDPIYFVNPLDIADYLASANITTQTAFGMTYIQDFLGLGSVITNSSIPQGTIAATAKGNIVSTYVPVNGAGLGEAFEFTTDETGYIGIHETPDYSNMTASDTVVSGIDFYCEYIDGVVLATVKSGASIAEHKYTQAELNQMLVSEISAVATEKGYSDVASASGKANKITAFLTAQGE